MNIRKRSDGRWEARIPMVDSSSGKLTYHSVYAYTFRECREAKIRFLTENTDDTVTRGGGVTFRDVLEEYLEYKLHTSAIKKSTAANYRFIIRRQLTPALGEIRMKDLTAEKVSEALISMSRKEDEEDAEGLSPKTVMDIRTLLKSVLKYAKSKGYPVPEGEIWKPRLNENPIEVFTHEDWTKLKAVLLSDLSPFNLGILLVMNSGLRIGEICALRWENVNLEEGEIRVTHTLTRIQVTGEEKRTELVIGTPKTEKAKRSIPMTDEIYPLMVQNRKEDDCYILTGTIVPCEPRVCLVKYKRMLKRNEIADHNFHALRHTFATFAVEMHADPKSLSRVLGHSAVSMTFEKYVHPTRKQMLSWMNQIGDPSDTNKNKN